MHVLVFAQVGGDLANFRVELDVRVTLLPEHDGVLGEGRGRDKDKRVTGKVLQPPPPPEKATPPSPGLEEDLEVKVEHDDHLPVARLENGMLDVVVEDVHLVSAHRGEAETWGEDN